MSAGGMTQGDSYKCPICKKESWPKSHPFCSKRCAEIDLGRWLSGAYFIPSRSENDEISGGD